jgi:hypothetical protein
VDGRGRRAVLDLLPSALLGSDSRLMTR